MKNAMNGNELNEVSIINEISAMNETNATSEITETNGADETNEMTHIFCPYAAFHVEHASAH